MRSGIVAKKNTASSINHQRFRRCSLGRLAAAAISSMVCRRQQRGAIMARWRISLSSGAAHRNRGAQSSNIVIAQRNPAEKHLALGAYNSSRSSRQSGHNERMKRRQLGAIVAAMARGDMGASQTGGSSGRMNERNGAAFGGNRHPVSRRRKKRLAQSLAFAAFSYACARWCAATRHAQRRRRQ